MRGERGGLPLHGPRPPSSPAGTLNPAAPLPWSTGAPALPPAWETATKARPHSDSPRGAGKTTQAPHDRHEGGPLPTKGFLRLDVGWGLIAETQSRALHGTPRSA